MSETRRLLGHDLEEWALHERDIPHWRGGTVRLRLARVRCTRCDGSYRGYGFVLAKCAAGYSKET